jgi:hypothetical protein
MDWKSADSWAPLDGLKVGYSVEPMESWWAAKKAVKLAGQKDPSLALPLADPLELLAWRMAVRMGRLLAENLAVNLAMNWAAPMALQRVVQ